MKLHRLFVLSCAICFICGNLAVAADGWKLPNLNPFKKSTSTRARVGDDSKWNMLPKLPMPKMPKMSMPKIPLVKTTRTSGPSTWQKLNNETKVLWYKTKGVLMPWSTTTSSNSYSRSRSRTGSSSKPSFLSSMFGKKEEPKRPRTVSDFLAQKRVPY